MNDQYEWDTIPASLAAQRGDVENAPCDSALLKNVLNMVERSTSEVFAVLPAGELRVVVVTRRRTR